MTTTNLTDNILNTEIGIIPRHIKSSYLPFLKDYLRVIPVPEKGTGTKCLMGQKNNSNKNNVTDLLRSNFCCRRCKIIHQRLSTHLKLRDAVFQPGGPLKILLLSSVVHLIFQLNQLHSQCGQLHSTDTTRISIIAKSLHNIPGTGKKRVIPLFSGVQHFSSQPNSQLHYFHSSNDASIIHTRLHTPV